eukprot:g66626.t1
MARRCHGSRSRPLGIRDWPQPGQKKTEAELPAVGDDWRRYPSQNFKGGPGLTVRCLSTWSPNASTEKLYQLS